MVRPSRVVKTGRRVIRLQVMKRPPKPLRKFQERGYRIFVGEFAPAISDATMYMRIAGKRRRWYLVGLKGGFELYDKRGRYYGTYTKTELFNGDTVEITDGKTVTRL